MINLRKEYDHPIEVWTDLLPRLSKFVRLPAERRFTGAMLFLEQVSLTFSLDVYRSDRADRVDGKARFYNIKGDP